jgi:hypothetical protein
LNAVSGYKIDFNENSFQRSIPNEIPFCSDQKAIVNNEIQDLLKKKSNY